MPVLPDVLFDFFAHPELPSPTLIPAEATRLLAEQFGLDARLERLGSQQDQNFLVREIDGDGIVGVLKISNPAFSPAEIDLQDHVCDAVAQASDVRVPRIVTGDAGPLRGVWPTSEGPLVARVLEFLPGSTLMGSHYLSPAVIARMGELAARVSVSLHGRQHPASARTLQWDPRHSTQVIETLLADEPDREIRGYVAAVTSDAERALGRVADALPIQLGHFDVTDDNVVRPDIAGALPDAIIDFGDVTSSWAVGEIAVTVSSLLHHDGASPLNVVGAIEAFHRLRPLRSDEIEAIWPLVVLRGAVLVLSGRQQVRLDPRNVYARNALDREFRILEQAASVPVRVMTALIRDRLNVPSPARTPRWRGRPVLQLSTAEELDAGTTSEIHDEGSWMRGTGLREAAAKRLDAGASAVFFRALHPVLCGVPCSSAADARTVPTRLSLWLSEPVIVATPAEATVAAIADGFSIVLADASLSFHGHGVEWPRLPARTEVAVELTEAAWTEAIPTMVEPLSVAGWRSLVGDPAAALGLPPIGEERASGDETLELRERVLADVQEHYYARPPRIERGWREHLIDTDGRVYLDMVNNVTSVGHAHPRIAEAATRQLRLLNTNSRFNYHAIAEYADRVAGTLPAELDTVFFVNSGSEANDLAIRLAMAATGRRDLVAMREAYHGWTYASDAVSTSTADNPAALSTRPEWIHTVAAANSFRGEHRGEDAANYAADAVAVIRELATRGASPAAFICEPYYGNAGGVALPDGYLGEVYAAVRELGGLTIADEVQVGFGRLGEWFWGFQQQDVVPDIVTVAKSIGSGQPIGAVITRREIAERYRSQGYFFSSTGGSPLSSVVGSTVLDIIRDERLQENARGVGGRLRAGLEELARRHPIIGAVHGSGLYLGLELVRDAATLEPATVDAAAICDRLLELGVIVQPTGEHQNVLKIKPPLCITAESADYFVSALDRVLATGW